VARITRVKKAQRLYHTKPSLDENGVQRRVPVMKKVRDRETGEITEVQKTTKNGRPVFRDLTVRDLTRPKPNLRCDFPGCAISNGEIEPGQPYKYMKLRFGQKNRHAEHPDWQYWEYSNSVAAQAARVQSEMHSAIDGAELSSEDDAQSLLDELTSMAEDFASEREEAVENMPEQLQDGSQAQEYAESARSWVDEFENVSLPDYKGEECENCGGTGTVTEPCENCSGDCEVEGEDGELETCGECEGTGEVEEDCTECDNGETGDPSEDWTDDVLDVLREAVDGAEF
jgi:hypothetical protein